MKQPDQFNRLEKLLLTFSFKDLNSEDRKWVLEQMSEGEFEIQRDILILAKELAIEEIHASISVDEILNTRTIKETQAHGIRFWWEEFLTFKIPAWQVAAFCLLAGGMFYGFFVQKNKLNQNESQMVEIRDTIYEEFYVPLVEGEGGEAAFVNNSRDSNYIKFAEYVQGHYPHEAYYERPLELTPISFSNKKNAIRRDSQLLEFIQDL